MYEIGTKISNKSFFASQQSVVYSQLISCIIIVFKIPMVEAYCKCSGPSRNEKRNY